MSGHTNLTLHEAEERQKRYDAYLQKIRGHTTSSTSNSGSSVNMLTSRGPPFENICNPAAIPAHNFYPGNTNRSVPSTSQPPTEPIFRMPQTTRNFNKWKHMEYQANLILRGILNLNNKRFFKLWTRFSLEFLKYAEEHLNAPLDPESTLQQAVRVVLNTWYDNYIPKSNADLTSLSSYTMFGNLASHTSDQDTMRYNQTLRGSQRNDATVTSQMADQGRTRFNQACRESQSSNATVTSQIMDQDRLHYSQASRGNHHNNATVTSQMADQDRTRYKQTSREVQLNNTAVQSTKGDTTTTSSISQQRPTRWTNCHGQKTNCPATSLQEEISESDTNLFNDTVEAQKRDERAAQQSSEDTRSCIESSKSSARPVKKVNNAKVAKVVLNNCKKNMAAPPTPFRAPLEKKMKVNDSQANNSKLNNSKATSVLGKAVTRAGRVIKSPNQYWKGNESRVNGTFSLKKASPQTGKVNLNESMTLRSNKIIDKNIKVGTQLTSAKGVKENTPLSTLKVNETNPKTVKKPPAKRNSKENKENVATVNQAAGKDVKGSKVIPSEETNQSKKNTAEPQKQVKKTAAVDHPKKGKSKEAVDTDNKKRKVEAAKEASESDIMSDDDPFGAVTFKRTAHPFMNAISPSAAMDSIKKAVKNMSMSKETPPARTLGLLMDMNQTGTESSASSAAMDAPPTKMNPVVKRVAKVAKRKNLQDMMMKAGGKGNQKESPSLQQLVNGVTKSFYSANTRLGPATYTMSFGTGVTSEDDSDISEDEDDDIF